jgi:DNA polymerase III epsilon subunit-like protein
MRRIRRSHRAKSVKYRKTWRSELRSPRDVATQLARFLSRHATVDMGLGGNATCRVARLAAHNAEHDGPFLRALFDRTRRFLPAHPRMLCTIQRAVWLFAEDKTLTPPPDFKLGTLCHYFGVPLRPSDAHDALGDAHATAALYRAMVFWSRRDADSSLVAR